MSAPLEETRRTSLSLFSHSGTDRGRRREQNEDAVWHGVVQDARGRAISVLLVADGIGGHAGGEVASSTVVEVMKRVLRQSLAEKEAIEHLPKHLLRAVREANRALRTMINEEPRLKNMGTTLVAALVTEDGRCCVVHMGDSRAYLVRDGTAFLLTVDHTWVLEALRRGRLSPEEARQHPNRHVVNQFLAGQAEIHPDFKVVRPGAYTDPFRLPSEDDLLDTFNHSLQLRPGDALVLCTDGLSDVVRPKLIADRVNKANQDPATAVRTLISTANAAGGPDNIGVAVLYAAPAGTRPRPVDPGQEPTQLIPVDGGVPKRKRVNNLHVAALAAAILFMLLGAVGFGMWLASGGGGGQEQGQAEAAAAAAPSPTLSQPAAPAGAPGNAGTPPPLPAPQEGGGPAGSGAPAGGTPIGPTSTPAALPTFTPTPSPFPTAPPPAEGEAGRPAAAIATATPPPSPSPGPSAADQQALAEECNAWAGQIANLGAPNGTEGPPEVRFEIFMRQAAVDPPAGCELRIGIGTGEQASDPEVFARCSELKSDGVKYTCIVREDISLLQRCTQGCRWWAYVIYLGNTTKPGDQSPDSRSPDSRLIRWNPGGGGGQQGGGGGDQEAPPPSDANETGTTGK